MENKICIVCKNEYPVSREYFYKNKKMKDGFLNACITCFLLKSKEYNAKNKEKISEVKKERYKKRRNEIRTHRLKRYYLNHEENLRKRREYRENNRDKINEQKRIYAAKNKEKIAGYGRRYRLSDAGIKKRRERVEKNRVAIRKNRSIYDFKRRRVDVEYKLLTNLRTRMVSAIKGNYKKGKSIELIGCTIAYLKEHLERQFSEGMTWENHTRDGWHIDHIIPCATFNLRDKNEQKKCFHFSNLRPLWAEDNLRKYTNVCTDNVGE